MLKTVASEIAATEEDDIYETLFSLPINRDWAQVTARFYRSLFLFFLSACLVKCRFAGSCVSLSGEMMSRTIFV